MSDAEVDVALKRIIHEGAALLGDANAVVAECTDGRDHGADLAHRGHRVAGGFYALRKRLAALPEGELGAEVEHALNFEQQIVEQALILGYRPDSPGNAVAARRRVSG